MRRPETFTCPRCGSIWPWEFNYCPNDGKAFRALKKESLQFPEGRPLPEIASLGSIHKLLDDVYGFMWMEQHAHLKFMDAEEVQEWLRQLSSIDQQTTIIVRYGLDGRGGRTQKQAAEELGVSVGTVRDRLQKAFNRLRSPEVRSHLLSK